MNPLSIRASEAYYIISRAKSTSYVRNESDLTPVRRHLYEAKSIPIGYTGLCQYVITVDRQENVCHRSFWRAVQLDLSESRMFAVLNAASFGPARKNYRSC